MSPCQNPNCRDGIISPPDKPEQGTYCPECEAIAHKAAMEKALQNPELYVPGTYVCPKCGFEVSKRILSPSGVSVDRRETYEICPNDLERMFPISWEYNARQLGARLMEEMAFRDDRKVREFSESVEVQNLFWAMVQEGQRRGDETRRLTKVALAGMLFKYLQIPVERAGEG